MTPHAGTEVTLVPPIAAKAALEATTDKSGTTTEVEAAAREGSKVELGSVKVKPFKPPATQEERETKTDWIEIELVGEDDKPIPGARYRMTLPDGSVDEGTLDGKGFVRVVGFEPGSCEVTFPDLDQDAWENA
jgi:type VI secretion system secreted protein VgrG